MNEYRTNKLLKQNHLYFYLFILLGLITIFSFFIPFLYTNGGNTKEYISGFEMLKLREDSFSSLFYGVNFFLFSYILGALLLLIGLLGLFINKQGKQPIFFIGLFISVLKMCFEMAGLILLYQCKTMGLNLAVGSYLIAILSSIIAIVEIFVAFLSKFKIKN